MEQDGKHYSFYIAFQNEIEYVLDGKKQGYFDWCGCEIKTIDSVEISSDEYTIIIAAEYEAYCEIYKLIRNKFPDIRVLWSKMIKGMDERKTVIINANCLRYPVTEFLNNCPSFNEKYRIIDFPATQFIDDEILQKYTEVMCYIVSEVDIYIFTRTFNGIIKSHIMCRMIFYYHY